MGGLFFRHRLVVTPSTSLKTFVSTYVAWLGIDLRASTCDSGVVHRLHPFIPVCHIMGRKTGSFHPCKICEKPVWRSPSNVARNIRQTCSKECKSKLMSGAGNPFWGKGHSEETRRLIAASKRARGYSKKPGPPKGYKHTAEAREKITQALKVRWVEKRDVMMRNHCRGENHPLHKLQSERRHRKNFTPMQRREWKAEKCAWCDSVDDLVLDHIIPVMAGGTNAKSNCQTLCRTCNIWKMRYVDLPYYLATLGSKEGQIVV